MSDSYTRTTLQLHGTFPVLGRLGADPELQYTQNGTAMCKLRVAIPQYNRATKEQETVWANVVLFGQRGETLSRLLKKGRQVLLHCNSFSASAKVGDGSQIYLDLTANDFELVGGGNGSGGSDEPADDDTVPF